ncbi:VOC family protein [Georgenia alba]|uniref:VOC family protein n=1 Tax=Georgenia alba TaxID=2233858 RepID=A0ABW2QGT4_9MICO
MNETQQHETPHATATRYRPQGFTSLTPLIVVEPAREAITFYQQVFGATPTTRMDGPDGRVWHCELDFGTGRLQLMDPNPQFHVVASDPATDEVSSSIAVYLADVDAVTERARALGARIREEPADFEVTGDRYSSIQDPFGRRWTVMSRTVNRSDAQIQRALDQWRDSMGQDAAR